MVCLSTLLSAGVGDPKLSTDIPLHSHGQHELLLLAQLLGSPRKRLVVVWLNSSHSNLLLPTFS